MLDQEGAREKMVQIENHYLWIDDSKLNKIAEVMSSLNLVVFVSLGCCGCDV